MPITQVTRRALAAALEKGGLWWAGDLDEVAFLGRLYDLDELPSTDPRHPSARGDVVQHCIANLDWDGWWVLSDARFELDSDDAALLRFLAECAHPEVRSDAEACRRLVDLCNAHLRPDGIELAPQESISGRPVFGWQRATPPVVTAMKLQDAIAEVLWAGLSAYQLADYCEGLGLGPQEGPSDDPMASKRAYVRHHTRSKSVAELVEVARRVLTDFDDVNLRALVHAAESTGGGVAGDVKNLIFAADGPKPELVLRDAINNDIEITRNAEFCLIYDRSVPDGGLSWRDLVKWWRSEHPSESEREAALDLHKRLKRSLSPDSPGESQIFDVYASLYRSDGFDIPALIPQVYLHLDPRTRRSVEGPLVRQRMDFLLLLPARRRVVLEVDGAQHYSRGGRPSPAAYGEMMREDRRLRLAGYEVYRFGADELGVASRPMIRDFFVDVLRLHGISLSKQPSE
jgi:hypothetical protein